MCMCMCMAVLLYQGEGRVGGPCTEGRRAVVGGGGATQGSATTCCPRRHSCRHTQAMPRAVAARAKEYARRVDLAVLEYSSTTWPVLEYDLACTRVRPGLYSSTTWLNSSTTWAVLEYDLAVLEYDLAVLEYDLAVLEYDLAVLEYDLACGACPL